LSITAITQSKTLPTPDPTEIRDRGLDALVDYLFSLVRELEDRRLDAIERIINNFVQANNVGSWYSQLPDAVTGDFPDGTWRIRVDGNHNLCIEQMVSSNWVEHAQYESKM